MELTYTCFVAYFNPSDVDFMSQPLLKLGVHLLWMYSLAYHMMMHQLFKGNHVTDCMLLLLG